MLAILSLAVKKIAGDALTLLAKTKGVSADVFVRSVLKEVAAHALHTIEAAQPPTRPAWSGHPIGQLGREDIYEDVQ